MYYIALRHNILIFYTCVLIYTYVIAGLNSVKVRRRRSSRVRITFLYHCIDAFGVLVRLGSMKSTHTSPNLSLLKSNDSYLNKLFHLER